MHPVLLRLPYLVLYSYGTAIVAAALLVGTLAWKQRPADLFSARQFLNICLLTTMGAAIGARVAGALLSQSHGFQVFEGGLFWWRQGHLSSLGVPLGVVPFLLLYLWSQRLPVVAIFDHLIPFALLGGAVQRCFGCFLAGCCQGKPTQSSFGVVFPGADYPVHPSQLYLGLSFGIIFILIPRWPQNVVGQRALLTLSLFGLVHLIVQPFRASLGNELIGGVGLSLIYGLWVLVCGLGFLLLIRPSNIVLTPHTALGHVESSS